MPTSPRHSVVAVWILGGRYEAGGWLEIRSRDPDLRWWEARCKVLRWDHQRLTGSMPTDVQLELADGGELKGTAYVDRALHFWGWKSDEADLKIHGTESGFTFREPGAERA
jgi:hypothetical protein